MSTGEIYQSQKIFENKHFRPTILRMDSNRTFGENLKKAREEKGFSLYYVSKCTGIPQPNLTSIEKGRRPASPEVLQKLSEVLEIEMIVFKAWQAVDQYGPDVLKRATKIIESWKE